MHGIFVCLAVLLFLAAQPSHAADQLLLTLQVESARIQWQEEFVLSLEVYGAPSAAPPPVTIDGLDQFQLRGQGQNLLQVPGGKTVKWILTYTLLATQDGTFKLGPAKASLGNRTFTSNTLFVTVEGTATEKKPKEETMVTPLVHSAKEVGDRVVLLLEADNSRPFRSEGFAVVLRLLSQLPVENLRFIDEAEFPGFLKYDFPYTDRPQAELVTYHGESYAAFDLQKFLIFPLREGESVLPPFRCDISLLVPSGSFAAAALKLDVQRASNRLSIRVRPLPAPADLVGSFTVRRELVADDPGTKTIRTIVEGEGLLSTFNFPGITAPGLEARTLNSSTESELSRKSLSSRKTSDVQLFPLDNTTDIVLPALQLLQFDPGSQETSVLSVPQLPLRFIPPPPPEPVRVPLPGGSARLVLWAWLLAGLTSAALVIRVLRPGRRTTTPGFASLFRRKKPQLHIPKNAAKNLYHQISALVALRDSDGDCLTETLKFHIPEDDWGRMEDVLMRLEWTAFSQTRGKALTYGELKDMLLHMERRWLA